MSSALLAAALAVVDADDSGALTQKLIDTLRKAIAKEQATPSGLVLDADGRLSSASRGLLEGMSVSVDVSTGEGDAGNRYFGEVSEVMDDSEGKHGVILLVQTPEPNFKDQRVGRAVVKDGRVLSYAFEQTDLKSGDYLLIASPVAGHG